VERAWSIRHGANLRSLRGPKITFSCPRDIEHVATCSAPQLGQITKTRQKMRFIKLVKLTGYTYACNSLTNFVSEVYAMTRNGNQLNLLKFVWQNLWNHVKWYYYWQVLAIWNYCAAHSGNGGLTGARYITNKSENTCNLIVLVLPSLIYYIY
jgi:hypothetical protein